MEFRCKFLLTFLFVVLFASSVSGLVMEKPSGGFDGASGSFQYKSGMIFNTTEAIIITDFNFHTVETKYYVGITSGGSEIATGDLDADGLASGLSIILPANTGIYITADNNSNNRSIKLDSSVITYPYNFTGFNVTEGIGNGVDPNHLGYWWNLWNMTYFNSSYGASALNSPTNNSLSITDPLFFNATITFVNETVSNATIFIWNSTGDEVNQTTNTLSKVNTQETNWTIDLPVGVYEWNVFGCSLNASDCKWGLTNNTLNYGYILNSETFTATVGDSGNTTLSLNITIHNSITISNVLLNYNGTEYATTPTTPGDDSIFTVLINLPGVVASAVMQFFWEISLVDSVNYITTTSNQTQTITPSLFALCNSTFPVDVVNFTIYDEGTNAVTSASFDATFFYSLSPDGTQKNTSISAGGSESYAFCVQPNATYYVDSSIALNKSGYAQRFFSFDGEPYNNVTTIQKLYLLNSTDSTSFVVFVRDSTFFPVSEAIVKVERFFPGTNTWELIESLSTNIDGKSLGHFKTEDVDYRFKIYVDGVLKTQTLPSKVVCEVTPCTITLTLPGTSGDANDIFDPISSLTSTLTYSKTTSIVTYSYIDSDSTALGGRLEVLKWDFGDESMRVACNVTSSDASGVLTCDLSGEINGTYKASGFISRTGDLENLDRRIIVKKVIDIVSNIGVDGVLWGAFLIMSLAMLGLFKPVLAIVFTLVGVIVIGLVGIISIPTVSIVAIVMIGSILIWEMRK